MREDAYDRFYELEMEHWFPRGRQRILRELIERYVGRPQQIADIGCGTGANLEMLASFGAVVGADFSRKAVEHCRKRGLRETFVAGLPHLPFPDAAFDLVCAFDVIEHIDDDAAAVRELLRICRPGGWMLLTVPAYPWLWSEHDEANLHKRRYTRRMLRELLAPLPVSVVKLTHFNFFLSPVIVATRLAKNLIDRLTRARREPKLDLVKTPEPLNSLLLAVLSSERFLIRHGTLPVGISMACLIRKRET